MCQTPHGRLPRAARREREDHDRDLFDVGQRVYAHALQPAVGSAAQLTVAVGAPALARVIREHDPHVARHAVARERITEGLVAVDLTDAPDASSGRPARRALSRNVGLA